MSLFDPGTDFGLIGGTSLHVHFELLTESSLTVVLELIAGYDWQLPTSVA